MKLKKYEDWLTGAFFLAVTLVYASQIPLIKRTKSSPVNSAFLPTIVAICMGALALVQLYMAFRNWKQAKAAGGTQEKAEDSPDYRRAVYTLATALIYVMLFKPLGFVLSSILYLTVQMSVMAPKEERRPLRFLLISVIAVAVIYLIFHNGLSLLLPGGVLTGIL